MTHVAKYPNLTLPWALNCLGLLGKVGVRMDSYAIPAPSHNLLQAPEMTAAQRAQIRGQLT